MDNANVSKSLVTQPEPASDVYHVGGMTAKEHEQLKKMHQKLISTIDLSMLGTMEEEEARKQIREIAESVLSQDVVLPLSVDARRRLVKLLQDEVLGLGPLEPLMADPSISDILVNTYSTVYVERHGRLQLTDVKFENDRHVMKIIDRIVSSIGRRIDESSPMVDARLHDGSRVNAIIPPLALDGPIVSIRRFTVKKLSMDDLIEFGTLTPVLKTLLAGVVKVRLNVVISGGTGSGKTTLLNVMSGYIPQNERVVTIEDSAELQFQHDHIVRLETRPPNVEGRGQVTQRDLVRNALRMRPDRIVLGEVRGDETLDMLQAMNTGHDGSLTTIHANTPRDALTRIENMVSMSGVEMPVRAVRAQMVSALNVVLQLQRLEDGRRQLTSMQEINGMEGDVITMTEIFSFERKGISSDGKVLGELRPSGMVPTFYDRLVKRGVDISLDYFSPM